MNKRIETKTSRTAETNCLIRALSCQEKRPEYKSGDYVSLIIMNDLIKILIKFPLARQKFKNLYPFGMYEYVIARTKYIDAEFQKALREGVKQVLIFGAGFDTRAIRLAGAPCEAKIFELDSPVTQQAKIERYREKGISVSGSVIFVPIDFDRQSIGERLTESGFQKGKKCLFIMEGLTMYLQPESVTGTFQTLKELSGPGSRVIFDFVRSSVVRNKATYDGAKKMTESLSKFDEGFHFGMEPAEVGSFLSGFGFAPLEIMDAGALEQRYFRDEKGGLLAKISETHCLVTASC